MSCADLWLAAERQLMDRLSEILQSPGDIHSIQMHSMSLNDVPLIRKIAAWPVANSKVASLRLVTSQDQSGVTKVEP